MLGICNLTTLAQETQTVRKFGVLWPASQGVLKEGAQRIRVFGGSEQQGFWRQPCFWTKRCTIACDLACRTSTSKLTTSNPTGKLFWLTLYNSKASKKHPQPEGLRMFLEDIWQSSHTQIVNLTPSQKKKKKKKTLLTGGPYTENFYSCWPEKDQQSAINNDFNIIHNEGLSQYRYLSFTISSPRAPKTFQEGTLECF